MADYESIVNEISRKLEVEFRSATDSEIESLYQLGLPSSIIFFYRDFAPMDCVEMANVKLWPIPHLLEENRDCIPGAYISQYGYIVFASNSFGDAYCFNLNEADPSGEVPIVFIAHDLEGLEDITKEEIEKWTFRKVADSLYDFLLKFLEEKVPFAEVNT
jgi:hypothetical protein